MDQRLQLKNKDWASENVQWMKVLTTKTDNVNQSQDSHGRKEFIDSPKSTHDGMPSPTHTYELAHTLN